MAPSPPTPLPVRWARGATCPEREAIEYRGLSRGSTSSRRPYTPAMDVEIHGSCDPAFAAVREAFGRCFAELGETGAAVSVYLDGRPVIDLWGGLADGRTGQPWERDTLVNVYSVTKPFAAVCLLLLVERGAVDLEAPVARYWPEFAAAGKGAMPVRWLLTHQAGLLGIREALPGEAIFDWGRICAALAAEAPWWEPGTKVGEHGYFYGHLAGEVVRRADGRSLGRFFREEVAVPFGIEMEVGVLEADLVRCATVEGADAAWREALGCVPGSLYAAALDNPPAALHGDIVNSEAWRRAEVPAVNGHATARGIARFYGALVSELADAPGALLSPGLLSLAATTQAEGEDVLLGRHAKWSLGFQVDSDGFGMGGVGGSLGWGNREARFGFGYVTNRMGTHDRAMAVYEVAARAAGFEPAP